jgi:hypothetical protein
MATPPSYVADFAQVFGLAFDRFALTLISAKAAEVGTVKLADSLLAS